MLAVPDNGDEAGGATRGAQTDRVDRALMATAKALRRAYDDALGARLGLVLHEANILSQLSAARSLTQVELARRVGVSRARVGVHIDSLVDHGAVKRVADPADRRVWKVSLTRRGRSLWPSHDSSSRSRRLPGHVRCRSQLPGSYGECCDTHSRHHPHRDSHGGNRHSGIGPDATPADRPREPHQPYPFCAADYPPTIRHRILSGGSTEDQDLLPQFLRQWSQRQQAGKRRGAHCAPSVMGAGLALPDVPDDQVARFLG